MLARYQKAFLASQLLYALICLVWLWSYSPGVALLCALVPWLLFAAVLGVEFVLMQRLNRRRADAPVASTLQVLWAWCTEMRTALLIFCWRQPFRAHTEPDWLPASPTGKRGVVLVHGFVCNRGVWLPWMPRLKAAGHACVAVNLEPVIGSIDAYAAAVEAAVQRVTAATGMPPVLICHSMGGLVARAWLRAYAETGAEQRVHHVITLGTPHAGTWLGQFSHAENGQQMRLESPWLQRLRADEPAQRARLFTCWYSNCDNIVFPATVAALPGARHRFLSGVPHLHMVLSEQVVQSCLEELAASTR